MDFSKVAGAFANAAGRIKHGLECAGIGYGVDDVAASFLDSVELEEAAHQYGRAILAAEAALDFTIDETLELEVDYGIHPDEILRRGGHDPKPWRYHAERPEPGIRRVRVAVGRFNKWLTGEQALAWLRANPERQLRGSGAWVREAYLLVRPDYDGKDEMVFLDEKTSFWWDCWCRGMAESCRCFPGLWHDAGRTGARSMNALADGWRLGKRFVFVLED